jgi:peptidoglycan/LPS O-acetylase OafA/YrhL
MNRMSNRSPKINDIQQLRGLAVLLSVFAHMPLATGVFIALGLPSPLWIGVPLFFVISGYVITVSTNRYVFSPLRFYIRRVYRIFPVLIVTLLLAFFLALLTRDQQFYGPLKDLYDNIIAIVLMYHNYYGIIGIWFGHGAVPLSLKGLWSISTEEQFYLLFPLLMVVGGQRWRILTLALLFFTWSVAGRLFALFIQPHEFPEFATLSRVLLSYSFGYDLILAGLLIYYALADWRPSRWLGRFGLMAALTYGLCRPGPLRDTVGYWTFVAGLVAAVSAAKEDIGVLFPHTSILGRAFFWLGERSYVIYVMHFQVLSLLGYVLQRFAINFTHPQLYSVGLTVLSIPFLLVIEVLHQRVERPGIRMGYRLCDRIAARTNSADPRQDDRLPLIRLRERG